MSEFKNILNDLNNLPDPLVNNNYLDLVDQIIRAKRIFLSGTGRSGLMVRAFANRLMQLGFTVSVVGEISEPHTHKGDLLILNSASGNSETLITQAKIAINNEVKTALITATPESDLEKISDIVIKINAQSKYSKDFSFQPMGALFEQSSLILFDSIVLVIMNKLKITEEQMRDNHADIE